MTDEQLHESLTSESIQLADYYKNHPTVSILALANINPNSFIFNIKGVEYMKIDEEGFFWKGKLVENDKEIYNNFKKFLKMGGWS